MWVNRKKRKFDVDLAGNTADTLEFVESNINKLENIPVVNTASEKMRKRVVGYTNPLRRMIKRNKKS